MLQSLVVPIDQSICKTIFLINFPFPCETEFKANKSKIKVHFCFKAKTYFWSKIDNNEIAFVTIAIMWVSVTVLLFVF